MADLQGMNYEVGFVPYSLTSGNTLKSNWVELVEGDVVHLVLICAAMAGSTNITINISTDLDETYTSTLSFDEYYKKADVSAYAGEDTTPSGIFTRTTGAAGTIATGATANQMFIIPIKAAELGEYSAALPYKCVQLALSNPGATDLVSCLAVFPEGSNRFKKQIPPTVVGYP